MNHAERIGIIIRDIEIGLETDNDDEIVLALEELAQIKEEIAAKDEVAG